MDDDDIPAVASPLVTSASKGIAQLRQITISADKQIEEVNKLLTDGWKLMSIGYQPDKVIYVLGRTEDKPRHRPGFLGGDV